MKNTTYLRDTRPARTDAWLRDSNGVWFYTATPEKYDRP